ncbi:LLM class F420-dependent oxidoreductase [Novosphingobium mangrovi (ex Huang et al. 2023)]|uniref:LLM class F420-dependent oxidoreductase n=1 Tax=Novosphingobium mangrovi (ex Huang et al. 2023) TaxID=2976432 RepID=A0ABT2I524_9SPHN|nr:LLM class F420-dependent oxidoreductase [Novosphingobium mangrovi (ex Huang et al. 2023)]MCT2399916.1 LLM class F420-dependent oxidoreductase [Novosphingobium mangrovi (ex Huang et al. 2023)]
MKLGIIYPQNGLGGDPAAVRAIGLAAEELGFDHFVAYDHVLGASHDREPRLWGPYTEKDPFHDPFVMFGYLAGITLRIELVTGILILPQRQTALVARQAADVDLLSGGRLRLGVGIGWNYVEYEALGQDFSKRGRRMAEQVMLLRRLWSEELVSFEGAFDTIDRAALVPRPERRIPIWMGGFADVALHRAAQIGDGFIFADGAADAFEQLGKLDGYLREAGRDAAGFGKQCQMLRAKTADQAIETAQRWRDAGGTHATINSMGLGFATGDEHIAYFEACADKAAEAGLL